MRYSSDRRHSNYPKRQELRHASPQRYRQRDRQRNRRYDKTQTKSYFFAGIIFLLVIGIVSTILIINFNRGNNDDVKSTTVPTVKSTKKVEEEKVQIEYTFTDKTADLPNDIQAEYGIVVDRKSGNIIAEKNSQKRAFPASTTKVMTLLVAVENIKDMNETFTMSYAITDPLFVAGASVAGFKNNEKITMTDLLYGTILPSGADAAMGLATHIAGSEENFVKLMNEKVKELKLKDTHFANVTGLHDENNYTTAYDMAIILDAAMENEVCKKVLSTYQHTTNKTPQNEKGILLSSTLFNYMYGTEPETATILGGKTGYVTEAGYCIASFGEANESKNEYIVVTFRSPGLWPAFNGQIALYKKFAK